VHELLGVLAFATVVVGYVLAVVFIRHEQVNELNGPTLPARGKQSNAGYLHGEISMEPGTAGARRELSPDEASLEFRAGFAARRAGRDIDKLSREPRTR
jgi:hypothetical protein